MRFIGFKLAAILTIIFATFNAQAQVYKARNINNLPPGAFPIDLSEAEAGSVLSIREEGESLRTYVSRVSGGAAVAVEPPSGFTFFQGLDIESQAGNDLVLGNAFSQDDQGAFLWNSAGELHEIRAPQGGILVSANDMNSAGEVVGNYASTSIPGGSAFILHSPLGISYDLNQILVSPNPLGVPIISATHINDRGDVVGACNTSAGPRHVLLRRRDFGFTVSPLPLLVNSEIASLNNLGDVAGTALFENGTIRRAFVWKAGEEKVTVINPISTAHTSFAISNSDSGRVLAVSQGSTSRPITWDSQIGVELLQKLIKSPITSLFAISMNRAGVILAQMNAQPVVLIPVREHDLITN